MDETYGAEYDELFAAITDHGKLWDAIISTEREHGRLNDEFYAALAAVHAIIGTPGELPPADIDWPVYRAASIALQGASEAASAQGRMVAAANRALRKSAERKAAEIREGA